MRMSLVFLSLAAVLLAVAGPALGQHDGYEWRSFRDDPTQLSLWRGGAQVGGYSFLDDEFRPFDPRTRRWGPPGPCPTRKPRPRFGCDLSRVRDGDHYRLDGKEVSRQEVTQLLTKGKEGPSPSIPDNRHKLRISVIGEGREPVLADLAGHPALAPWKDKAVLTGYAADHWAVARYGFVCTGRPTIYVQDAEGRVLHRQDDYRGGAAGLAEALRNIDPDYRPERDKDLRKGPSSRIPRVPWSVPVLAAAAVAVFVIFRRKS